MEWGCSLTGRRGGRGWCLFIGGRGGAAIEKVPDEDGVVVRGRDNLEIVKLEPRETKLVV